MKSQSATCRQEGRQEGLAEGQQQGERRLLLRQIRRRFSEAIALQSASILERIEELTVFEDLGEELLDCADEAAWLARLQRAAANENDVLSGN